MLHKEAARILQLVDEKRGSVKNLTFASSFKNKRQLMALVCETLKFNSVLQTILDASQLQIQEKSLKNGILVKVLMYDLLFGQGLHGETVEQEAIVRHAELLNAELERLKADRNVSDNKDLLKPTSNSNIPRYVRVNTLKLSVDDAIQWFCDDGYNLRSTEDLTFTQYLDVIRSFDAGDFAVDLHIPELLVFAASTDFHDYELYLNGSIILQDKASCLPAVVLSPSPGSHVIDCCAAPGNKTSQLAAIMANKGRIFAFDKDAKRITTMKTQLTKAGAVCVQTTWADFLRVDPHDPEYNKVEYILVDPSCSGSGIISRVADDDDIINLTSRLKPLASFQAMILRHAMSFPSVRRIVYSTCSVHNQENECVVQDVLERTAGSFRLIDAAPSLPCRGNVAVFPAAERCVRLGPESSLTNGFFVACFERAERGLKILPIRANDIDGKSKIAFRKCSMGSGEPVLMVAEMKKKCQKSKEKKEKPKVGAVVERGSGASGFVSKIDLASGLSRKVKKNKRRSKRSIKRPVTA